MKKYIIVAILLTFMFSCGKSNEKSKESIKIDSLKQVIASYKKEFDEKEFTRLSLYEENKLKLEEIISLQKQKDSIILLTQENIDKDKIYQKTSNDNYWDRGAYYTSQKSNEFLYNVKVSIINNQLRFYFIGIEVPYKGGDLLANIYELDENKELYVIDTIALSPGIEVEFTEHSLAEDHIREFVLLQLDNLIVKNDKLYYFKIKGFEESYNVKISNKDYYEYNIGSKKKSQKIDNPILSNTIVKYADNIVVINKDKSKLVVNYGEDMSFHNITDWEAQKKFIDLDYFTDKLPSTNFDLSKFFKESEDELYFDRATDECVLFGGLSWHNKKDILYFDNSGMTYRCIWQIDFDNNEVIKIVPEHEAIQPHFFEIYDKEYIAYVEENKIMLCEPPSNNEPF